MRNRLNLTAVSALAALALACGNGSTVSDGGDTIVDDPSAAASSKTAALTKKVGQSVAVSNSSQAITYTVTKTAIEPGDDFNKPTNGVWLAAYLTVSVSKGSSFVCACELSFVEPAGTVHESTYAGLDGYKAFESADVAAGQKTAGWVFFDTSKSSLKGGKIQLKVANLLTDNEYAYWTLP